jgi:hypothetical protein
VDVVKQWMNELDIWQYYTWHWLVIGLLVVALVY